MNVEQLNNIVSDIENMVAEKLDVTHEYDDREFLETIEECVVNFTKNCFISFEDRKVITERVFNSMKRNDILQPILDDKEINEIMVNGTDNIYIEKHGRIEKLPVKFDSHERLFEIIQNIVSKSNKSINESNPIVDLMMPDGSRLNVVLNPIAINGPCITIRKFPKKPLSMKDLIDNGMLTEEVADFLRICVGSKYNILISGGTSTGKTTLLNALSEYINQEERVISIEDSAELLFSNIRNLVRLETRDANCEGVGEINMRKLIKTSLRMRPDRLIVGEVRDEAAFDMLQALNTGHDGSMSTLHANSAKDALMRLETMVLCAALMPIEAIRHQIASGIEIIIHIERDKSARRKVTEVVEIVGCIDNEIKLNTLFSARKEGETLLKVSDLKHRRYKLMRGNGGYRV